MIHEIKTQVIIDPFIMAYFDMLLSEEWPYRMSADEIFTMLIVNFGRG